MITLDRILESDCLVLYGIGNQFRELYKLVKHHNDIVLVDSDEKKQKKIVDNHIIYSPEEMTERIKGKVFSVIISSIKYQFEIAKNLVEKYGIDSKNVYMYSSDWYEKNIYKEDLISSHACEVEEIANLLADESSKEYYMSRFNAISKRDPLLLAPNENSIAVGEYKNVVKIEPGECIIDGGAYTGDTVEMYINKTKGKCKIYAFEPFSDSFLQLEKRVASNGWNDLVECYNCAIGRSEEKRNIYYFEDTFGMAINLSSTEGQKVQRIEVIPIDKAIGNNRVTYIKMDIEGEEVEALLGARRTIKRNHPKLMISGYHRIEDFWLIPKTIWEIDETYEIFVGHAPNVSTEMEYYCI